MREGAVSLLKKGAAASSIAATVHPTRFTPKVEANMKSNTSRFALLIIAAAVVAACSTAMSPPPPNTLMALRAAVAPVLDGNANDAVWAAAPALAVNVEDGANFGGKGETTMTLKAVYTADTLYMLVQYADPTQSVRRVPFQKQADGSWKKLGDPNDKGGDNNVYYEDKWSVIWNVGNSIKDFNTKGCAVTCHVGEGKPFGNKYTASEGELGDMWHSKGMRTLPYGKVDDQRPPHVPKDRRTFTRPAPSRLEPAQNRVIRRVQRPRPRSPIAVQIEKTPAGGDRHRRGLGPNDCEATRQRAKRNVSAS